ncbi:sugar nucleotide-binding protein [Deinococcus soli (ex Cha et al. 2016)]|uniref:dTDP-4-dehydrorhamnose reductase n=2 Tax=Deinococcus soli (ex Cha et al. 2016) TaxID=1309411 RepID=A0ACC6KJ45_9DEIO|nr:sugar nucleotide-binding protein [Deinococcus soli (ex Cha et al. 2016)]MDR6219618.1 dTDP-4-dehydrorhamnose reductase [Deinococcus soli (ex Cha et al. 2016)]MDR6329781.1 dTDP-4-dehydrorhamnose reductase [Deinococcus soli (ex Cha et al. 2016)]MDR6752526.1 dTDP-4-dehydrorhamnose reductase [Deinococcus soli (ex Cha et al. 2016)]
MKILLTGGGGRLGTELRALLPGIVAPTSAEMNITDAGQVLDVARREQPDLIVHAAAYTNVGGAEKDRDACWNANVVGTRTMAAAANDVNAKLVHISTDYVFSGDTGGYREDDTPGPVVNYYALTKLIAEEAARAAHEHLIIRTSFRPREFAYPVAFSDVFTGQDYVDVLAPQIAQAITHAREIPHDLLHIVTERKSVFELARRRKADVQEGTRAQAGVTLPGDVSLDTRRWRQLASKF